MFPLRLIWVLVRALFAKRADLVAENLALRQQLIVVKPATVVRWHRQGFKYYWAWKSRHKGGRPAVAPEVRDLIRKMSRANPLASVLR